MKLQKAKAKRNTSKQPEISKGRCSTEQEIRLAVGLSMKTKSEYNKIISTCGREIIINRFLHSIKSLKDKSEINISR
jgi:hypothetical protein